MGHSWVIAIELEVPKKKSWLASTPDPARFDAWPSLLDSSAKRARRVSALLDLLSKETFASVEWNADTLTASAILSNGGSFWVDACLSLAAAIRSASDFGAEGELAIVNAFDNTQEIAVVVSSDGRAHVEKAKQRTAIQKRLAKLERKLGDAYEAEAEKAARARPFVRDERLHSVHAEIIRALREADAATVLAAAKKWKGTLSLLPKKGLAKHGTFATLYASAPALIDALERGDERVHSWCAGQYLAASLEILHAVSKAQGALLAKQGLAALKGRTNPTSNAFRDVAVGIDSADTDGDPNAELVRLRRELPTATVWEQRRIRLHPIVERLEKRRSGKTRAAILAQLEKVIGNPKAWKTISEKDASFGFALTHLLEMQQNPEDAPLLKALWKHPHWMIANQMKARAKRRV